MPYFSLSDLPSLSGERLFQVYGAADATGTLEVANVLLPLLSKAQLRFYRHSLALQGPALHMSLRGVLIDRAARKELLDELRQDIRRKEKKLDDAIGDRWTKTEAVTGICRKSVRKDKRHSWERGKPDSERVCTACGAARLTRKPFNAFSAPDCQELFYATLALPPQRNKDGKVAADEEILGRIERRGGEAGVFAKAILDIRAQRKQESILKTRLSPDGRFRCSFSVAAAWTARWASSKAADGVGGNIQTIPEQLRRIFIADPGMEMFYADLERAESLVVAYVSGDERYIEAHEGDTHSYVANMVWPEIENPKETPLPWDPHRTYRHAAKQIQHGITRGLSPGGMAIKFRIPHRIAKQSVIAFTRQFPGVAAWQREQAAAIEGQRPLVTPLGRTCSMLGRPWDERTHRQGWSFTPQALVADVLNTALWWIWRDLDPDLVQVLAQCHDAILGQYPKELRNEAVPAILERMALTTTVVGLDGKEREMTIPVEIKVGKNWGPLSDDNPEGLQKLPISAS